MGRRKTPAVEGAILDLTGEEPVMIMTDVIEQKMKELEPEKKEKKEKKAKYQATVQKLSNIADMTDADIANVIMELRCKCSRCERESFAPLRVWGGGRICGECYDVVYPAHRDALEAWVQTTGPKECAFCGKTRVNPSDFHYDHVNMFDKTGAVGIMLFNGVDLERIKAEIGKCQLLCVECHGIVTKMEHRLGFIYIKTHGKKRVGGYNKDEYLPIMSRVYRIIKELRRGRN
jgi:hypothetical protein